MCPPYKQSSSGLRQKSMTLSTRQPTVRGRRNDMYILFFTSIDFNSSDCAVIQHLLVSHEGAFQYHMCHTRLGSHYRSAACCCHRSPTASSTAQLSRTRLHCYCHMHLPGLRSLVLLVQQLLKACSILMGTLIVRWKLMAVMMGTQPALSNMMGALK